MIYGNCVGWDVKLPFIHYSAPGATTERVVFGRHDDEQLHYAYDDHLMQWDYEKWKSSRESVELPARTPRYWQEVLRKFWDDPGLELGCIVTGVNQSNGFQYFAFGYKRSQKQV